MLSMTTDQPAPEMGKPDLAPAATPLIDLITCDGADSSTIALAASSLGAEIRPFASPEVWQDFASRGATDEKYLPADLAIVVGGADRIVVQRWVSRCRTVAPDTVAVAAPLEASLDQVSQMINQGAQGLIVLPNTADRISQALRELLEPVGKSQAARRAIAKHRRQLTTLTRAELDVLEGMLEGLPNKKIATELSIGLRTVELRRSKIMRKMQAKSLSQLISFVCAAQQS